jgi:hypothetical protein
MVDVAVQRARGGGRVQQGKDFLAYRSAFVFGDEVVQRLVEIAKDVDFFKQQLHVVFSKN